MEGRSLSSSSLSSFGSSSSSSIAEHQLPLLALNHVSFVVKSVQRSVRFYEDVLGFVLIKRPSSFDFEGAWLFNHGVGIHLLEVEDLPNSNGKKVINPKDNHISFQCTNMEVVIQKLEDMKMEYVTALVKEGGITVDQMFFHDPDGYMIEICNCQNLPVLPISACPIKNNIPRSTSASSNLLNSSFFGSSNNVAYCSGEVEAIMMENLAMDMINISF